MGRSDRGRASSSAAAQARIEELEEQLEQSSSQIHRLQHSVEWLTTLFDNCPDAVYVHDERARILDGNRAAERLVGRPRTELLGRDMLSQGLIDDESLPLAQSVLERLRHGEPARCIELRLVRGDGLRVWAEFSAVPIETATGRVVIVTARPTEARRQTLAECEAKAEQRSQAERLDALGRLGEGIADDMDAVLGTVLRDARALQDRLQTAGPLLELAREIIRSATYGTDLTRQLRAFSPSGEYSPVDVCPNEVVQETERTFRRILGGDIELSVRLDGTLGCVHVDRGRLEQSLATLVVRARDAMPKGGTLSVETRRVSFDAAYAERHFHLEEGAYALIRVQDSGERLTREQRARIFEPFCITTQHDKRRSLGLAAVYATVRRSGGHVQVRTPSAGGSAFELLLPERRPAAP